MVFTITLLNDNIKLKEKDNKILIYINNHPYKNNITKIIIKKKIILHKLEEEEDYWELIIKRANKITTIEDIKKFIKKIEDYIEIETYNNESKKIIKQKLNTIDTWKDGMNIVNIKKLREENKKLFKKFINRVVLYEEEYKDEYYCYAPYNTLDWFNWFYNNKSEYMIQKSLNITYYKNEEPKLWNIYL